MQKRFHILPLIFFVKIYFQEELKEVFEGSCQLIPIKLIANECIKLADQFVPELVETLASEMNPDTVCSVAGEHVFFVTDYFNISLTFACFLNLPIVYS